MKKWFSLDEQAHQLGVPGKTHDLKALAKEFGGFGSIPVDDPRFRST
jgi:DNA polymerase-1